MTINLLILSKPKGRNSLNSKKAGILDEDEVQAIIPEHKSESTSKPASGSKLTGTMQITHHIIKQAKPKPKALKCLGDNCEEVFPSKHSLQ